MALSVTSITYVN